MDVPLACTGMWIEDAARVGVKVGAVSHDDATTSWLVVNCCLATRV